MSSAAAPQKPPLAPQNDGAPSTGQGGAKKKNKKKKAAAAKAAAAASSATEEATGAPAVSAAPDHDDGEIEDEPPINDASTDTAAHSAEPPAGADTPAATNGNGHARNGSTANGHAIALHPKPEKSPQHDDDRNGGRPQPPAPSPSAAAAPPSPPRPPSPQPAPPPSSRAGGGGGGGGGRTMTTATTATTMEDDKVDRAEVERLRQQVEALQQAQAAQREETEQLRADLEESEAGREQAETQYQNLLGRVEKIKETLGDRLKRDKHELEEAKDRIEELEAQMEAQRQSSTTAEAAAAAAEAQVQRLQRELDDMEQEHEREQTAARGRSQLSQQNWQREKEELGRQVQQLRAELESTTGAMEEWEVIAMEERSVRASLAERAADLEEQLAAAREQLQQAARERSAQAHAVDSLQRALQEIQEARKHELREMVQESERQREEAEKRIQQAETAAEQAVAEAATLRQELERTAPFEREVKEKNLLIGKLRHESIVLNDHLTRALRYIKKNKPEENVDRQVVTNHLLQFLALDRSDPKKFQVLQVIAGMLNWTDEQKEKAGLARPGAASSTLRLPSSPFHRTPSTPALSAEFFSEPAPGGSGRESLADLWAGFLERSVEEAASETSNSPSRKGSTSGG